MTEIKHIWFYFIVLYLLYFTFLLRVFFLWETLFSAFFYLFHKSKFPNKF